MLHAAKAIIIVIIITTITGGCDHFSTTRAECTRLVEIAKNEESHADVIRWLDSHVFSHEFSSSDVTLGRLGFPGRHGALKSTVLGGSIPAVLSEAEVRPVYFYNNGRVGGVFVGRYNGIGLLVDHVDIERFVAESGFDRSAFEWAGVRIAVACAVSER